MKYTVIVGRPDYVSDNQLQDTVMTHVDAGNPAAASFAARLEAAVLDATEDPETAADDYVTIAVIEGEHWDVKDRE